MRRIRIGSTSTQADTSCTGSCPKLSTKFTLSSKTRIVSCLTIGNNGITCYQRIWITLTGRALISSSNSEEQSIFHTTSCLLYLAIMSMKHQKVVQCTTPSSSTCPRKPQSACLIFMWQGLPSRPTMILETGMYTSLAAATAKTRWSRIARSSMSRTRSGSKCHR